jgi:hypothetical protein
MFYNSLNSSKLHKWRPGHLGVNNGFNSGFNSDLKVSSMYNTGHNKWKVPLPTKLQFKDDKNPTWRRVLDAVGCSLPLLRRVCWPTLEECYVEKGLLAHA